MTSKPVVPTITLTLNPKTRLVREYRGVPTWRLWRLQHEPSFGGDLWTPVGLSRLFCDLAEGLRGAGLSAPEVEDAIEAVMRASAALDADVAKAADRAA